MLGYSILSRVGRYRQKKSAFEGEEHAQEGVFVTVRSRSGFVTLTQGRWVSLLQNIRGISITFR